MAMEDEQHTFLRPVGYQIGDCGYCKQEGTSASYYVVTRSLRPDHYQIMMDRGWRRSGTLMYLPDATRSCCPHYTIRLPASEFRSSRDHRQALHRWNRYVLGEEYSKKFAQQHPKTKETKKLAQTVFDLHQTVHAAEALQAVNDFHPEHRLQVSLEPDSYSDEKFELFANYQQHVHHESAAEITKSGFRRFLCDSPLQRSKTEQGKNLGSFHQCYRLDGRLIAVSVLDLLPHAVSGVYFMYHSDYERWSMGKLSALREIALAAEMAYHNYYMGYYIHGCEKMKYKGTYKQQYVLDYEDMQWSPLDDHLLSLMDKMKFVSLSSELSRKHEETVANNPITTHDSKDLEAQRSRTYIFETPAAAVESARSLLDIGMPGVMSLKTLQETFDCGQVWIYLRQGRLHQMEELTAWDEGDDMDTTTLRGIVAEYSACVGPDVAEAAIIDFSS